MAERGGGSLKGRERMQLWLQSLEGGLYGSKESWQDEEESPGEEKGRWQEEEVSKTLLEAIH